MPTPGPSTPAPEPVEGVVSTGSTTDLTGSTTKRSAYAAAGVSVEAGDRAVELMKQWVEQARRPEVVGGIGGFAGLFDASALKAYKRPLLATSADGVGTKVAIAQAMDVHDTIGFDLVGMLVDDLVVCGAEPLFMTDYIACGKVVPERIAAIVKGIAQACAESGTALLGGETAEHPGLLGADEYDVAGSTTGVVEADRLIGAELVKPGDVVVAMASSGLHSNGYSLVRNVLLNQAGWALDRDVPELGQTLGEALLTPTRLYTKPVLDLIDRVEVHALSHITGGGLAANLARVVPDAVSVRIDRSTWELPPIFSLVQSVGRLSTSDVEEALNIGVGMVGLVAADAADAAVEVLGSHGIHAWIAGDVAEAGHGADGGGDGGTVVLDGAHR